MLQYFHLSTIYDKYRPISTDKTQRIWKAQTFPRNFSLSPDDDSVFRNARRFYSGACA